MIVLGKQFVIQDFYVNCIIKKVEKTNIESFIFSPANMDSLKVSLSRIELQQFVESLQKLLNETK